MSQNMKVDIIYYSIASDFEMEFNLCGCCRMRLLTDKTGTQVEFVKSIARSVKRSKVIFACGPLFGDKGLIATVSKATGIKTTVINNEDYGIESKESVAVLDGSTPLVTSDGVFGGCIFESGPQTIIILSESRSLRKKIMKSLIYPYITKLSLTDMENSIDSFEDETPVDAKQNEQVEEQNESLEAEENDTEYEYENEIPNETKDAEPEPSPEIFNKDFVIPDKESEKEEEETEDEFNINTDFDIFISEVGKDKKASFESQNQRYYLVDDHELEDEFQDKNVFIRIMIIILCIIAVAILYIAVAKPLIFGLDIVENLKRILNLKVFNSFELLFRG